MSDVLQLIGAGLAIAAAAMFGGLWLALLVAGAVVYLTGLAW